MGNEIIKINNLSFKYNENEQYVLKNLSLSIKEGEWVSIVGHNGSGKSTLAKFLNGLLSPKDPDVVLINGVDTIEDDNIWEVRKKVGIVFQNPDNQMVATTVRDDVAFGLENIGVPRKEMLNAIEWALKKVKMEAFVNYEPHRLSGGQKQRVAIAGILAMRPSILVLDEATSMLDPIGRKEVLNTVWELSNNEGITIINITHDLDETLFSNKILVMNKGQIECEGTPVEVFQQPDTLYKAGLELPFTLQIQQKLTEQGYRFSKVCLTKEDLVDQLWKLKSKI